MSKMHKNELEIDEQLVRALLKSQCPQWAQLPLQRIKSSGTDHALFRLGNNYVIRLPRLPGSDQNSDKECLWLPKLAHFLKTPISASIFKGTASDNYPLAWMVTTWFDGEPSAFRNDHASPSLATELADFVNALHAIKLEGGPLSRRGISLITLNDEIRQCLTSLKTDIDVTMVATLWEKLSHLPDWHHDPVWVHGDLLPGNIIVKNNSLHAVIDWSDVGMGDPACDCTIAWSLFNASIRNIFKTGLNNISDIDWERGRGRALAIALIIMPYYKQSNPVLYETGKRIVEQVLQG